MVKYKVEHVLLIGTLFLGLILLSGRKHRIDFEYVTIVVFLFSQNLIRLAIFVVLRLLHNMCIMTQCPSPFQPNLCFLFLTT